MEGHAADLLDLLLREEPRRQCSAVSVAPVCFERPWKRSVPVLSVLEPETVPVPDPLKLVQDDGRENWTRADDRLQKPAGEELQFRDVSIVKFCDVAQQLTATATGPPSGVPLPSCFDLWVFTFGLELLSSGFSSSKVPTGGRSRAFLTSV